MVKRTKIKKYYAFANIIIPNSHVSQQNIDFSKLENTKKAGKFLFLPHISCGAINLFRV